LTLIFSCLIDEIWTQDIPAIYQIDDVSVCHSFRLPDIEGDGLDGSEAYFTVIDGKGIRFNEGQEILESQLIFAYIDVNGLVRSVFM
jgi:hypothetical protein